MYLVSGHLWPKVGERFCSHQIYNYQLVSWIQWCGRLLDRFGKSKQTVMVSLEHLAEIPVCRIFNSQLQGKFLYVPKKVYMESEWAMLKVSIVDAASRSCSLKVIGACCSGHQRACWWTQVVMEAVTLKKEAFRPWLSHKTSEADDRCRVNRMTGVK